MIPLVYFNRRFSHAVCKRAAKGEFRIHAEFGGTCTTIDPSISALQYGAAVLHQVPTDLLYARVDLVETIKGPRLIELEITDPMLYLKNDPKAAEEFAAAVALVL